jgi:hypothetical protein
MHLKDGFDACFPAPEALPDDTAGSACSSDMDCGGAKDTCLNEIPYSTFSEYANIAAPGGYCTQPCSLDSECGAGGVCISRGSKGGMCLKACHEKAECREGYGCELHYRDADGRVCVPRPESRIEPS